MKKWKLLPTPLFPQAEVNKYSTTFFADFFIFGGFLGESPHNSDSLETGSGSGRPVRAAVVNAAAITEAQNDIFSSLGRRYVQCACTIFSKISFFQIHKYLILLFYFKEHPRCEVEENTSI